MDNIAFKNILVVQTAFLGDVVLATALVHQLKQKYPDAHIDFLTKKENVSVLAKHPDIRETLTFDKSKKWKEIFRLISKIRKSKYDLLINCHRFASSGLIAVLSGAKYTVGFDKNPFSFLYSNDVPHIIGSKERPFHEIQRNHSLVKDFLGEQVTKPYLHVGEELELKVQAYKQVEYICIAPSSVWFTKQLPEQKWAALIRKIPESVYVYILGGVGDVSICERIKSNAKREHVKILAGKLSIMESAALMKDAVINYVNDSAPTHLASAVNARVCTVYCSTVPEFGFDPLSDFSKIVEIKQALSCRPCNLHGKKECPEGHFCCANNIDVHDLVTHFEEAYSLVNIISNTKK